ncbi:leucyl/phenylalanyl-tRNA--protein transferase [Pseudolysobacter antarcticus]|uniref:Leucyl/phenylalanyl-tRNA--protein transferase n=1 Tax=Pseudolysobacter antarcticus TaxID=2511995 RepID=A0A411HJ19_9GAMM|nr:leucyl/phenylalanyl-tRNA--protein transferase [Pseudolysobacter antarcticus]QBB70526.1 leucyl/phenylalanyl-tRNA--protein transferase [Pseudolysobacter antarcticus]
MSRLKILHPLRLDAFPAVDLALQEPNGLLAMGGDLSVARLLDAYRHGIFPWYSADDPILWWSPDPRMVFATDRLHVPRRLQRWLRQCDWQIRADHAFRDVMSACAEPRDAGGGTWITEEMLNAYNALHNAGHAHSVEVYDGEILLGGIYGVAIGRMFFGESMFSRATNASKVALIGLCRALHAWGFALLDAQVTSAHLQTLGAREISRRDFIAHVEDYVQRVDQIGHWRERFGQHIVRDLF